MQTVQETWDFLSSTFDAGDERQRRPEESVTLLGETQEYCSSMSIHIFHFRGGKKQNKAHRDETDQSTLDYVRVRGFAVVKASLHD